MEAKKVYYTRGFRNTEVHTASTSAELKAALASAGTPQLLTEHRTQHSPFAKGSMISLIVGQHIEDKPMVRKDENFKAARYILCDYDDTEHTPQECAARVKERLSLVGAMPYVYMECSASGKFHALLPRLSHDTKADINRYSEWLDLPFDECVTNTSRLCVLTGEALVGTTLDALFLEMPDDMLAALREAIQNSEFKIQHSYHGVDCRPEAIQNSEFKIQHSYHDVDCRPEAIQNSEFKIQHSYHGVDYSLIVDELIDILFGGMPQPGERNLSLYKVASELRPITDCNPQWISALMKPHGYFALPEAEATATIASACRKDAPIVISKALATAIEQAREAVVNVDVNVDCHPEAIQNSEFKIQHSQLDGTPWSDTPPVMPKALPPVVRLLLKNFPAHLAGHVLNHAEAALAMYLMDTECYGIEGSRLRVGEGIMAITVAPPASGKSSAKILNRLILDRLRQQDLDARAKIEEWNELAKTKRASDLPERPKVVSHMLGADATPSAFLLKLKQLDKGALYCSVDELSMLAALKNNSSDSYSTLLLAFGSEELEVDRSSEAGVSGVSPVRLNLSALGTKHAARKFFANGWHSGLISRISMSGIWEPEGYDDDEFSYGKFDTAFETKLATYIDLLTAEECKTLSFPKCDEHARLMARQTKQIAAQYSSEPLRIIARRQAILAQKRAYLWYILCGKRWTPQLEAFLTWRYWYSLFCTFNLLGTHIDAENRKEENADAKKSGPPSWLLQLPATFNYDQLVALRKAKGASTEPKAVKHLIAVWKNKQLITEQLNPDGTVTYTKI
ncbi:MAG: DUF3987 domain-containing protein [Bacteroidaceae bacterium]|nr:DUF3987 domain-containing protein [Bacteroidaceae bacterium]